MKKQLLSILIILIINTLFFAIISETHAVGIGTLSNPDSYIRQNGDNSGIIPIANIIVGVIKGLGAAIAILTLTIIGLKYIIGSAQEKAEYKQTMWPYIIGAILIFAGTTLVDIIYQSFQR